MSRYEQLFEEYVEELRAVRGEAFAWWEALLARNAPDGDIIAAEQRVRPRWPAGPVSHPRVIAVYRKFWLRAARINEEVLARWDERASAKRSHRTGWGEQQEPEEGVVKPGALLTENLIARDRELYDFIADLVFQPIGVNYDGEYA